MQFSYKIDEKTYTGSAFVLASTDYYSRKFMMRNFDDFYWVDVTGENLDQPFLKGVRLGKFLFYFLFNF